jgi:hypothetical protein
MPSGVTKSSSRNAGDTAQMLVASLLNYLEGFEDLQLRVYGLRADGQPAVELKDDDLILPYASTGVRIAPAGEGDVVVPEPESWRELRQKLPRVGFAARKLWHLLELLREGAIDPTSIRNMLNRGTQNEEAKKV